MADQINEISVDQTGNKSEKEIRLEKFISKVAKLQDSHEEAIKKIGKRFHMPKKVIKTFIYAYDLSNLPKSEEKDIQRTVSFYARYA